MLFKRELLFFAALVFANSSVFAHGFVGKRFFPAAISQTEPFINDKLALPVFHRESPGANNVDIWTTNPQVQYAKGFNKKALFSITANYLSIKNPTEEVRKGFDNWQAGLIYNIFLLPRAQSIFSIGLNSQIGGTGSKEVNADNHTTLSPQILFAQGFGALPLSVKYLRPLGFSTSFSPNIVSPHYTINSTNWGLAIEYSLPYLNQYVRDFNAPVLNHIVPIVEFQLTRYLQGTSKGQVTATTDPGVILYGKYGQIAIEALIPNNRNTGSKIGGVIQFYLYLDAIS